MIPSVMELECCTSESFNSSDTIPRLLFYGKSGTGKTMMANAGSFDVTSPISSLSGQSLGKENPFGQLSQFGVQFGRFGDQIHLQRGQASRCHPLLRVSIASLFPKPNSL